MLCQGYTTAKIGEVSSFFGIQNEQFMIHFADGKKGEVYIRKKDGQAYFKEKKNGLFSLIHYYENMTFCISALHSYLTTGKISNEGYVVTYS